MYLKLVRCLCIALSILSVRPQRVWGPGGYNSGFSGSWNPNGFSNGNPFFGNNNAASSSFGGRPNGMLPQPSNWGYEPPPNGPVWGSNRPEKIISGSSGNRKEDNRPQNDKLSAVVNRPSSSQWNAKPNSIPEDEDNNLSSWGFDNVNVVGQGSSQNERPGSQNSNWNNYNVNNNDNYNKPKGNEEENSVLSSWGSNNKKKPKPNGTSKWETTTQKNNKYSGTSNFDKNNKKPQKPSGTMSGTSGKEKNTNSQNGKKETSLDTSILDELDKNDWYFGKESNYPKPPFKSKLNIDVSELWNFDKNKKTNQNSTRGGGSNNNSKNSRRNRQIEGLQAGMEGIKCECVSVNLCDEEDMIVTQEDIKYDFRPLQEFRCEKSTEVCCTNPKVNTRRKNFSQDEGQLRCGQRRIGENPLDVYGENVADPGEFPWNLRLENAEENCSASLIHHKLALTAAHCVTGAQPGELTAKAGVWNSDSEPFQTRRVAKIIPHPDYSSLHPRNDIALLVLETPFELTDNVNTICLPVTNDKWDPEQCVVVGWRAEEIQGQVLEVLEKGGVNFLPQTECQNIILVTDLWRNYILHDSFVCGVESSGRKSCTGEDGGFLVCPSKRKPDTFIQIGVVSKGMSCDGFGRPGIFTNVLQFLDWINENYFELGLFDEIDIRSMQ